MAANKIPSHQTEDVLQEIRTRKAEVKSQIKESADFIKTTTHKLFTPPPQATSKLGSFMNMVDQGLAVYDGVMMGMRVARNIRRILENGDNRLPQKPFHKIAGKNTVARTGMTHLLHWDFVKRPFIFQFDH